MIINETIYPDSYYLKPVTIFLDVTISVDTLSLN